MIKKVILPIAAGLTSAVITGWLFDSYLKRKDEKEREKKEEKEFFERRARMTEVNARLTKICMEEKKVLTDPYLSEAMKDIDEYLKEHGCDAKLSIEVEERVRKLYREHGFQPSI